MPDNEQPDPSEILNALPFAVFTKNQQGEFTWVNDKFAEMAGAEPSKFIGKSDWDFYATPFVDKYQAEDKRVLDTGEPIKSYEILHTPNETEPRYIQTSKRRIMHNDKVQGILGVFMDIGSDSPLRALLDSKAQTIRQTEQQLSALVQREEPKRQPRVFVSYKHSTDAHLDWVRRLATDLVEQYGIHCILDQFDLDFGDSIPAYMQRIQTEATHVLFIITPECVTAIEDNSGGVSFEMQLAMSLRERKQLRIIPLLRAGIQSPAYVQAHLYIDFRDDTIYPDMLRRLADSIRFGKTRPKPNSKPPGTTPDEG